jgi:hypothetical protein
MRVQRLQSGGQTGADRAACDCAIALGIPLVGWCPQGRRAEDGVIPACYPLRETDTAEYAVRTRLNVFEADATVLFARGVPTGGSRLTTEIAGAIGRPLLHLDLEQVEHDVEAAAAVVRAWLARHHVGVLNVAGSRESEAPGIYATVRRVLLAALRDGP